MENKVEEFLKENNAIEGVFDDDSLKQANIAWKYLMGQEEMNPGVMLKTHKILMLNQEYLKSYERGYFRKDKVYIGGKEALNWRKIEERIEILAMNMWLYPKNWKHHHIEYEKIHPFVDGNGRTVRMFMNWQRVKQLKRPLLIIHTGKEQFEYYKWFN